MEEETEDILVSFGLTTEEVKQYNVVKGKFEAQLVVKRKRVIRTSEIKAKNSTEW